MNGIKPTKSSSWADSFLFACSYLFILLYNFFKHITNSLIIEDNRIKLIRREKKLQLKEEELANKRAKYEYDILQLTFDTENLKYKLSSLKQKENACVTRSQQLDSTVQTNILRIIKEKEQQWCSKFESENSSLLRNNNSLLNSNRSLIKEADSIESTFNDHEAKRKQITNEVEALQVSEIQLQTSHNKLKTESKELLETMAASKADYKRTKEKYCQKTEQLENDFNDKFEMLNSDFNRMQVEYHCRRNAIENQFEIANATLSEMQHETACCQQFR